MAVIGCCGNGNGMGALTPGSPEEIAALKAELSAVQAKRRALRPGLPWWAWVGGGILAAAAVGAVARRWGRK